ncbi:hypothetical protein [Candidatus Sororendozoicomonas aggregata]|uniref:hypothetical protein n=1 Tax=Candidatus Sororendozoicomonas aggregata TaxID=3073239 RepID=UPI002ED33F45
MATTNIWQKFKALIPESSRYVVTIAAHNGDGTSRGTLRNGVSVQVKGEAVAVGEKAFVVDGEIMGAEPGLAQYEVEV